MSFFDEAEQRLLGQFCRNAIDAKGIADELKTSLFHHCILDDASTKASVAADGTFMTALFTQLCLSLSNQLDETSKFGLNIVSDFDLVHNFSKDSTLLAYITSHSHLAAMSSETKAALKKASEKCKRWIRNQRTNLIGHWDLPDGDAPEKAPKKKREVAVVTAESAEASSNRRMERLSHERTVSAYNVLASQLDYPTITMTETESSSPIPNRERKNARTLAIEPNYPNSEPEDEYSMVAPAPRESQSVVLFTPPSEVSAPVEVATSVMNAITLQHLVNAIPNLNSDQGVVISINVGEGYIIFKDVNSEEITHLNLDDIVKDYSF